MPGFSTNFLGGRAGGWPGPAEGWGRWRGSLVVENLPMCRENNGNALSARENHSTFSFK